ncbi:hypothetical protein ACLB2K_007139 [Fragaria x ananassa]
MVNDTWPGTAEDDMSEAMSRIDTSDPTVGARIMATAFAQRSNTYYCRGMGDAGKGILKTTPGFQRKGAAGASSSNSRLQDQFESLQSELEAQRARESELEAQRAREMAAMAESYAASTAAHMERLNEVTNANQAAMGQWMQLGEYKDYVTNKSAPEGCIAEAYIGHESVTYMKLYLGASLGAPQTMEEHAPRFNLSIVSSDVEVGGARLSAEYALSDEEIAIAHWRVLINCEEVKYWKELHLSFPEVDGDLEYHNMTFANYFRTWIFTVQYPLPMDMIKSDYNPNWSDELLLLAMQPQRARVYPTCTVNDVKFVSEERDNRRITQNSGVMAKGHGLDYYGVLHSVVELVYAEGMKVHLFKCRWFDTGAQSMKMDQYDNLSVNTATSAYEDDPFVFATSVKQVFYLDDLARGDAWKIANIMHPRNIYRAATLGVTIPGPEADAYQEPNAVGIHDVATVRENNVKHGRVLRIRDEYSTFIDVDPNEETDDDSDDELRHRLPDINSDTEEDSSDDSDYEP